MKTFTEWLSEGEQLYVSAIDEFKAIETQINQLEVQLSEKRGELNQIARVIGKPTAETVNRVQAEVIEANQVMNQGNGHAIPVGRLARALTGRGTAHPAG